MTKAQKAQRDYEAARAHLRKLAGVGNGRRQWHSTPANSYYNGDQSSNTTRPGMFDVEFGVDPSPAKIQEYLRYLGKDKQAKGRAKPQTNSAPLAGGTAPLPEQGESIRSLLEKLALDQQYQQDAANAANEGRYQEVRGAQDALYNRTMGEVDNWGNVQSQLNEERAREAMGNIRGNLASRGLTDSTIGDAFQARSNRDLALTQQDLSERKSARRLGYDIDLTKDANAFTERRVDRAPDNSALLALSAKLGEAEAYRRGQAAAGQRAPQAARPQQSRLPQYGGVSPAYAQMLASNMQNNFQGQLGSAMSNYFQGGGGGPAYVSNRYPTPRGTKYASNAARRAVPIIPPVGGAGIGAGFGAIIPGLFAR